MVRVKPNSKIPLNILINQVAAEKCLQTSLKLSNFFFSNKIDFSPYGLRVIVS